MIGNSEHGIKGTELVVSIMQTVFNVYEPCLADRCGKAEVECLA